VLWPYWWAVGLYVILTLGLLATVLLFFGQPIIKAMRWLIERGKRVPPAPFNRRWRS
jgi:hypothetical protein